MQDATGTTDAYFMYLRDICEVFVSTLYIVFVVCYAHSKGPGKVEGTCRPHCFGSEIEIYEHNCGSSNKCCV